MRKMRKMEEGRDSSALSLKDRKMTVLVITALVGAGIGAVPLLRTRPFPDVFILLCLFFGAAVALSRLFARRPARLLLFCVTTFLFTFTLEAVGTATGLVFGFYRYGDALGPKLLDVPVVIGLLWCLITLGCIRLSLVLLRRFGRPGRRLTLLTAPLGCVFFDLCIEPHAGHLGWWRWSDGAVPLRNFIAWGAIAFLVTGFYLLLDDRP
ncbi:MAG: carotenoid biosynthesis protein [Spirochaetales bacterium]|nr:carotenoid biosynthesis protein [Spirochaetales bacterium]